TSGASFVKKSEQLGLLKKMIEAGDFRGHIPEVWKNRVEVFNLSQGVWAVKHGEETDPEEKIKSLLDGFRISKDQEKLEKKDLVQALQDYLRSDRGAEAKEKARKVLYILAGQDDALREKIDRIQDKDYTALLLLEQLFGDKDNLQKTLAEALSDLSEEFFATKGEKQPLKIHPKGFLVSLRKVCKQSQGKDEGTRLLALAKMLGRYRAEDLEEKILTRNDLED